MSWYLKINQKILNDIFNRKLGFNGKLDFSLTYEQQGLDDLDSVEFIMEIEKDLDIMINDDLCEEFLKLTPNQFLALIREHKINNLLEKAAN
jgi:acyl carrier protein